MSSIRPTNRTAKCQEVFDSIERASESLESLLQSMTGVTQAFELAKKSSGELKARQKDVDGVPVEQDSEHAPLTRSPTSDARELYKAYRASVFRLRDLQHACQEAIPKLVELLAEARTSKDPVDPSPQLFVESVSNRLLIQTYHVITDIFSLFF